MISKNIALNIIACLSGLEFSFDELILETKELFEKEGIPGFLRVLIGFTDNLVVEQARSSESIDCCSSPHLKRIAWKQWPRNPLGGRLRHSNSTLKRILTIGHSINGL